MFKINITDEAKKEFLSFAKDQSPEIPGNLRVWISGGGCGGLQYGMAIDTDPADPEDYVQQEDGFSIYIDQFSQNYLNEATIEWSSNLMGGGFKIDNPNVVSCGCGSSFSGDEDVPPGCNGCGMR